MFARKILPKIQLLCVLAFAKSQNYEYSADEGGAEGEIQENTHPDYSKYYSVTPKDGVSSFEGFSPPQTPFSFEPYEAVFGASSQDKKKLNANQVFAPVQSEKPGGFPEFFAKNIYPGNQHKDYFEQAQTRQQEENQEESSDEISEEKEEQNEEGENEKSEPTRRGPNYISHDLPTKIPHQVETVKVTENLRVNNYNYVNPSTQESQHKDYKNSRNQAIDYKYLPHLQPVISQQHAQLYPQASGIQNLPLQFAPPTPYQKYSFQPTGNYQNKYLENLNSATNNIPTPSKITTSPTELHESKSQPKSADRKNCIKMKRNSGDKNIADLTCYVCENKEKNSKITECAYQSEPDSTDSLKGSSQRYSVPAKNNGFRYRRATSEEEEETDAYEYVKRKSLKAQNEKENIDDLYGFEGYEESQPEKSYSELQSEEILKDPKKCSDVQRDGMSCRVCKDPVSGGNFESCSYTSAPKPDKYAYVSEKNYNSNDDPQNAGEEGESKNIPVNARATSSSRKINPKNKVNKNENEKQNFNRNDRPKNNKGLESKHHDRIYSSQSEKEDTEEEQNEKPGHHFSESNEDAESRQEPENAENENQEESDEKSELSEDESPYGEIGEYKFKYFPEFSLGKSENEEPLDYEASSRKEVEDVLADFKKRDRSQCQQTKKNGMTCFLCVGENKVKNEECMFISESKPKATIAKYTKNDGITKQDPADAKVAQGVSETKRKEVVAAASSEVETRVKAPFLKRGKIAEQKASASAPDAQRLEEKEDDPKLKTPTEFQTTDEEGAYSAETKPVYSKTLGMSLPKYMLEKSEFEKEFDASSRHY